MNYRMTRPPMKTAADRPTENYRSQPDPAGCYVHRHVCNAIRASKGSPFLLPMVRSSITAAIPLFEKGEF